MSYAQAWRLSDLAEGVPLGVRVGQARVALVREGDAVHAIADECTHARILLSLGDFDPELRTLECVGHGVRFDLTTGAPLEPPASRPVPIYPTRIDGEDVLVDLDQPKES